jgi:hypothetical protein
MHAERMAAAKLISNDRDNSVEANTKGRDFPAAHNIVCTYVQVQTA